MTSRDNGGRTPPYDLPDSHLVGRAATTDEAVFDEEREKILDRAWRLACHDSELGEVNDFRAFDRIRPPLFMIRADDGGIRCFVNVCSHRGARLVNEPSGNARRLVCFFHHWSYDSRGRCINIPRGEAYAAHGPDKADCGLREVRCETYKGLVFFNLDDNAPPLADWLGDAFESLDAALDRDLEVFHYSRGVLKGNWKDWQSSNMDPYHEFMHARLRRTNVMTEAGMAGRSFQNYPNGHARFGGMAADYSRHASTRGREAPDCLPGVDPDAFQSVPLFPNGLVATRGTVMRIDITTPLGPLETLVEWRGLCVKGLDEKRMMARIDHHNEFWGPYSANMPEDAYAVESLGRGFGGGGARYQIIAREEGMRGQDEGIMRGFHAQWSKMMGRPASSDADRR